jgi:hypothetical protein
LPTPVTVFAKTANPYGENRCHPSMKTKVVSIFLLALGLLAVPCFASEATYDQQEQIRRFLEKMEKEDQRQREAAKERADRKERDRLYGSTEAEKQFQQFGVIAIIAVIFAGAFFWVVRCIGDIWPSKQEDLKASAKEDEDAAILAKERGRLATIALRDERIRDAGNEFTGIINEALTKGANTSQLEKILSERWGVTVSINDGKLNVTEMELLRIRPLLPEIKWVLDAFFGVS